MHPLLTTALMVGAMAAVVLLFRAYVRHPRNASHKDPPGVRTVVVFSGDDPQWFGDDRPEESFVGVRLFAALCDGLAAGGVGVENRGKIDNAHRVECVVGPQRFALVLEWSDPGWTVSVEWVPDSTAEKRHLALTGQVFAPPDGEPLRRVLTVLDDWLKAEPELRGVRWYRKEQWMAEDTSNPADRPLT